MILKIELYGAPVLRQKTKPVKEFTPEIKKLIKDMVETVDSSPNNIGLAANQVGGLWRILIIKPLYKNEKGEYLVGESEVYVNPELSDPADELETSTEGCLSFPGLFIDVERPTGITVKALNEKGESFKAKLTGFKARQVMHENDHLNGVLYIDRIKDKEYRKRLEPYLKKIKQRAKNS
jgi:peptide deformylase